MSEFLEKIMEWAVPIAQIVGAIGTVVAIGFLVWRNLIMSKQLDEMRRINDVDVYFRVLALLQDQDTRTARGKLHKLKKRLDESGICLNTIREWRPKEKEAAEHVCQIYDRIGNLLKYKVINPSMLWGSLNPAFERTKQIGLVLLEHRRATEESPGLWGGYKWLSEQPFEVFDAES